MIQKKREEFKRDIRRKQLEAIFKERRIELLEPVNFQHYAESIYTSPLGRSVAECLNNIEDAVRFCNMGRFESGLEFMLKLLMQNTQEASAYLMVLSPSISRVLRRIIENHESLDEGEAEWGKLSEEDQLIMVTRLFDLLSQLNYREVREEEFRQLLAAFWLVFTCGSLSIYQQVHHHLFDLVLLIFKRMLASKNRVVLSSLKAIGLGQQLTRIIQFDMEYLNQQNETDLMEVVEIYVTLEAKFQEDRPHEINGKLVLELQKAEKEILVALCLSNIDFRREENYYPALNSLVTILERHPYLISSIAKYAKTISNLISSHFPKVQLKALELIDDLCYQDDGIGIDLLRGRHLPDLLYSCLLRHRKDPCETTYTFCCITANILCNLSVCKNRVEEKLSDHPIWQLAYENIQMGSPLLPLVSVFEYFFEILHRKTAIKFLESYLNSVGALEAGFLDRRQQEAIRRTIQRVYVKCLEFWPEGYQLKFRELIHHNNLQAVVEDLMEVEEQRDILHPL